MSRLRVPVTTACCPLRREASRNTIGHRTVVLTSRPAQVGVEIRVGGCRLFLRENFAKDAKPKGVPNLQIVQGRKYQRQVVFAQIGSGQRRVPIDDVAGHEETAVGVDAHSSGCLFTAFEQNEVRQHTIAHDAPAAHLDIGPGHWLSALS
jgi:hypothetical protein